MGESFSNVVPYAVLIEDPGAPQDHLRPDSVEKGAGELEVGFEIDGTRFVLFRVPAGRFLKDQRLAQEAQQSEASQADQPTYGQ